MSEFKKNISGVIPTSITVYVIMVSNYKSWDEYEEMIPIKVFKNKEDAKNFVEKSNEGYFITEAEGVGF